ncbi:hypothetical protein ASC97_15425 [Rhizobium sp. Root1203]|uniref:hypothetical protein n=1 Tax=Rhizobium sp. Root1203 TaxID=1736427 RepID=UPI000714C159|nr:hypothetical protein [Rhizobium sp. Root1203]KQV11311.1 hypothetical protein ASC97_15425 [Rhizobium sp. Root1203]
MLKRLLQRPVQNGGPVMSPLARYYRDLAEIAAETCDAFEARQPNEDVRRDFYDALEKSVIESVLFVHDITRNPRFVAEIVRERWPDDASLRPH